MTTSTLPRIAHAKTLPKGMFPATGLGNAWLMRIAAWADRQPPHRRLGSWTAV